MTNIKTKCVPPETTHLFTRRFPPNNDTEKTAYPRVQGNLIDRILQRSGSCTQPLIPSRQVLASHLDARRLLKQLFTYTFRTCPVQTQPFVESVLKSATIRMDQPIDQLMIDRKRDIVEESSVGNCRRCQSRVKATEDFASPWK